MKALHRYQNNQLEILTKAQKIVSQYLMAREPNDWAGSRAAAAWQ
jgi:hypothetical protein